MQGIVIANVSNSYEVKVEDKIYICSARGKFKLEKISPVVGDKVEIEVLEESKKEGVILSILPRTTYIKRPKVSNITQIVFVLSLESPKPDLLLLDKQLAFAELNGIQSIICINKVDLKKKKNEDLLQEIEKDYTNIGYPVILTKAKEKEGIDLLKEKLQGKITAFSGNSGVGKSTLINSIFQKEITLEGIVSKKNQKGKNTTTAIRLYEIEHKAIL
ncbi:MAG: ribosome small subunit-dependent GTPase A [Clostridia bacterium]